MRKLAAVVAAIGLSGCSHAQEPAPVQASAALQPQQPAAPLVDSSEKAKSGESETTDWEVNVETCRSGLWVGGLSASGVITNNTARRRDYLIAVEFRRADDVRIGQRTVTVNEVVGGDTVRWAARADGEQTDGLQCPVTMVTSFPDGPSNTPTTRTQYDPGQD